LTHFRVYGSYLAELLLEKSYQVHGLVRRSSQVNTKLIENLLNNKEKNQLILHFGDLTDSSNILQLIQKINPDEIYNLAAQSHVKISIEIPEYTSVGDGIGTLKILEAIRSLDNNIQKKTRFYQAGTSEMYGKVLEIPQNENTPFNPQSPYACAKVYSHFIVKNYREGYGLYACNGILFNHERARNNKMYYSSVILFDQKDILSKKNI
jgi:GDPmannose 4,6-dehydratase